MPRRLSKVRPISAVRSVRPLGVHVGSLVDQVRFARKKQRLATGVSLKMW